MLNRIYIDGYKSIDRAEVQLGRFTLLSGINSAGKSSIIQAILYMSKTYGENFRINQIYEQLGRFADIRNSVKGNKKILFELEILENGKAMTNKAEIEQNHVGVLCDCFQNWNDYMNRHRIVYLSVERVGVQSTYKLDLGDLKNIDQRGEYTYSYLALHGQEPLSETDFLYSPETVGKSLNNQVNYWLDYLMGFYIRTNIIPDVDQVVVTYSNAHNNHYYRAANVGTGVTFISTLIIAALSCRKEDTLIIENPEIHLHPRAQSRLMEFMAYLSDRGLQIILETHSDHIYNGMRKSIKKMNLPEDKVSAYFLQLDDSMQTELFRIHFNEQGAEMNHPYGMFDQFDDDLDELLEM